MNSIVQDPDLEQTDIESLLSKDRRVASEFTISQSIKAPSRQWDIFYKSHQQNFFKDRHWTHKEYSVLADDQEKEMDLQDSLSKSATEVEGGNSPVLLEVGCGVGNMCFPLLEKDPDLRVHCCDFSPRAVELVKTHPNYTPERVNAFVYDLTTSPSQLPQIISSSNLPTPTFISTIFVLSAIQPDLHLQVLSSLVSLLPKGGSLLFRDYAYGDLAQLRFHSTTPGSNKVEWHEPSLLDKEKHWYKRGDGTLTYFFKKEELEDFAERLGLEGEVRILEKVIKNRKMELEMKRRWTQVEWKKA